MIVSGPIGDHGIAVMAAREGIDFETALVSDSAPVVAPVAGAARGGARHPRPARSHPRAGSPRPCARSRSSSKVGIRLEEAEIPVRDEVRGACELLGFDPLYVACEGRFLAIVPGERADARSRRGPLAAGRGRRRGAIGAVVADDPGRLVLRTRIGSHRLLERLSGEQLPRIC